MSGFHDSLAIRYGECPADCRACIDACAQRKNGGGVAAIKRFPVLGADFGSVITCNQCRQPKCMDVCFVGAISKSESDGVVRIDQEKCIGCGLCTLACRYGGISYSPEKSKAFKCDTCDGNPKCVEACPEGVLSFISNSKVLGYLGEDRLSPSIGACQGCGAELLVRASLKVLGKEAVIFTASSCLPMMVSNLGSDKAFQRNTLYYCRMTNIASSMTGIRRYFRRIGKDAYVVAFAGDGSTADVGFQNLSAAAERGENIIYICYDNEGYMNTGIQRSSTTPLSAWTTTTPVGGIDRGKSRPHKNIPAILAFHRVAYVATATTAFLEDYVQKLTKAMALKDGMAYIHFLSPCPTGWRALPENLVEVSRMAVETNVFPLWEAERGKFRFTYQPKKVKPVAEYTRMQGRFAHLSQEELSQLQTMVDANFALIEGLTNLGQSVPVL